MQTSGATLVAVERCSLLRMWMSAEGSGRAYRLPYLAAVRGDSVSGPLASVLHREPPLQVTAHDQQFHPFRHGRGTPHGRQSFGMGPGASWRTSTILPWHVRDVAVRSDVRLRPASTSVRRLSGIWSICQSRNRVICQFRRRVICQFNGPLVPLTTYAGIGIRKECR
jgi:hypothetical protein